VLAGIDHLASLASGYRRFPFSGDIGYGMSAS